MYWADWNRVAPKIEVANMDGGSRRAFVQQRMGLPNGLTLDRRNEQLCWTDAMYGTISCAGLNDGRSQVVYSAARLVKRTSQKICSPLERYNEIRCFEQRPSFHTGYCSSLIVS
jgi:hypothetical protein